MNCVPRLSPQAVPYGEPTTASRLISPAIVFPFCHPFRRQPEPQTRAPRQPWFNQCGLFLHADSCLQLCPWGLWQTHEIAGIHRNCQPHGGPTGLGLFQYKKNCLPWHKDYNINDKIVVVFIMPFLKLIRYLHFEMALTILHRKLLLRHPNSSSSTFTWIYMLQLFL